MISGFFHNPNLRNFGLHSHDFSDPEFLNEYHEEGDIKLWNRLHMLGWFPGIGLLVGSIHVYLGMDEEEEGYSLIGRGIAEILCLGPLLFLFDLIVTLGRYLFPARSVDSLIPLRDHSNSCAPRSVYVLEGSKEGFKSWRVRWFVVVRKRGNTCGAKEPG